MRSLKKDQFIFHVCLLVLDIQINEIVLTLKIVTCTYIKPCREIYYCIPYLLVTSPVTNIRHLIFIFDSSALTLPMSNGHQNLSLLFITYYLTCHSFCSPNAPPIVHFLILSQLTGNIVITPQLLLQAVLCPFDTASKTSQLKIKSNIITNLKKILQIFSMVYNVSNDLTFCLSLLCTQPSLQTHTKLPCSCGDV